MDMGLKYEKLSVSGTRGQIRRQVITKFLDEEPGTGKGENCSKYIYEVEKLNNGDCIFIKRPASLNKGVDFTVHVENIMFRERGFVDMPSHNDIIEDLELKKENDANEYEKVKTLINKIYNCEEVSENEFRCINFNVGYPVEAILKSIKWLFIEQDVTYWNWSGRFMLFTKLKQHDLC